MENIKTEEKIAKFDNSKAIDRIYYHEFMMDELNAALNDYKQAGSGYDWEREEFVNRMNEVKEILNDRLIRDLKTILHMA